MAYLVNKSKTATGYNNESAIHTLRKDNTGILYYSKVNFYGDEGSVNLSDGSGFAYSLDQIESGFATDGQTLINDTQKGVSEDNDVRQYNYNSRFNDQVKIDHRKVTYYIDNNGFLVARFDKSYPYAVTQNGVTGNWQTTVTPL
jgi:hypothetical protein